MYIWQKDLNQFSNSLKLTIVLKYNNLIDNLVIKINKIKERMFFRRKTVGLVFRVESLLSRFFYRKTSLVSHVT